jgi:hypothetical protein
MDRVGTGKRASQVTRKLRCLFPRLFGNEYHVASKKTRRYNCLAWALGHSDIWCDAAPDGVWPDGVLDDGSVLAAIRFFEHFGYVRGTDAGTEKDVLKIAIYGDERGYTHAARQLSDGRWSSKLGAMQDIEHDKLENLFGSKYGTVVQIMEKRPTPAITPSPAPEPSDATAP